MNYSDQVRKYLPQNQLFHECFNCNDLFKSGDHIYFSLDNKPICEKCYNAKRSL